MSLKNRISAKATLKTGIAVLLIAGFFYGCNTEKKIAKSFVYQPGKRNALVFTPDFLYKENQKTWLLDSLNGNFTNEQKDSLLWEMSDYIKNIDDSIFIKKFSRGFLYQLAKYGFDVYGQDAIDLFMKKDSEAYVINIPQIELDETIYPYKDKIVVNGYTYFHQHYLNAIDMGTWFEISKVNDTVLNKKVMFADDLMTDDLNGSFDYDEENDRLKYFYKIDTLTVNQIYNLAILLGKRYAGYTYDYLLNKYILSQKQPGDTLHYYWHYDIDNNRLYPVWDEEDRLVPVEK